jgi:lipopolysaccharide export system permease protein
MIINRAFIREVVTTAIAVTIVIITIFLVVRMMGFLNQAAEGLIPVEAVLTLVALKMTAYLDVMIPLMFYIALLMVFARWYRDNEMAVLASAGMGIASFIKPASIIAGGVTAIVALFAFYLTPQALAKGYTIEAEYRNSSEVSGITPGRFIETREGGGVYYVESFNRDKNYYENIFVYKNSFNREGVVVSAIAYRTFDTDTGYQFLVLKDGTRYEGTPGTPSYRVIDFETYALRMEPLDRPEIYLPVRALPNAEIAYAEQPILRGEWYWRMAKVIVFPVLTLFALGLSFVDGRTGRASGMVTAFLVYLLYTNILGYMIAAIKKGDFTSSAPIWLVHLIFSLIGLVILYRRNFNLPLWSDFHVVDRLKQLKSE